MSILSLCLLESETECSKYLTTVVLNLSRNEVHIIEGIEVTLLSLDRK